MKGYPPRGPAMRYEWKIFRERSQTAEGQLNDAKSNEWQIFAVLQGGEPNVIYIVGRRAAA